MPNNTDWISIDPPASYDGVLMGFDFGMKRIGLAVGQTLTRGARPLQTLAANQGTPDWRKLHYLILEWRPKALVVGIPLNMDGTEQPITHLARNFAKHLKERYNLPVHGVDERLTTRDARERVFAEGGYRALQNSEIDAVSASLILTSWMNQYC